jgi:hypothetical protein
MVSYPCRNTVFAQVMQVPKHEVFLGFTYTITLKITKQEEDPKGKEWTETVQC